MEPIPQTREAFDWLGAIGNRELEESLLAMSRRVRSIVPECIAMSVAVVDGGLTFTLLTDRPEAGMLDAMQYLDGGPCLEVLDGDGVQQFGPLPTDEGRWQMFARAEALVGIRSTLSMPLMREGAAVGGVNLYGSTEHTFDGHHEQLAEACGAWAEGAITNADLSFTSRVRAAATRDRLMDQEDVELAVGIVAKEQKIDATEGESRLRRAANRAGVSPSEFARFVLDSHADQVRERSRSGS